MKSNRLKPFLRWWIALTSLAAFGTGWVVLGHFNDGRSADAASTAPTVELTPLPTLEPLPSLQTSPAMRPLQVQPANPGSFRLRTGAS